MKTNLMKKAVAVTLSVAMACSASAIVKPMTTSAATKAPTVSTTFKTLKIGEKHKLKLVNGTGWKVTKSKSGDKAIAKNYITKSKYVKVKGLSEGRATVKVTLKNTKTKKSATAKCRYKVTATSTNTPDTPDTPATVTAKTVKTQEELNEALANKELKTITIETDAENLTIGDGTYADVDLVVDAPNAEIVNGGKFKSVTIKAIKDSTWIENAVGNILSILASKAKIVVGENASVEGINFSAANADVKLEANGTVKKVTVSAKLTIAISGKVTVPVDLTANATDTKLTATTPVEIDTKAKAEIVLGEGAADSKIAVTANDVAITVENNTGKVVELTKADGSKENLKVGKTEVAATTSQTKPGTTTPTPGTTTPSVNKAENTQTVSLGAISAYDVSVNVTSGSATVISSGSVTLSVNLENVTQVSGAAIGYYALFSTADGKYLDKTYPSTIESKAIEDGGKIIGYKYPDITVGTNNIAGCNSSGIKVKLVFYVAGSNTQKDGAISEQTLTISTGFSKAIDDFLTEQEKNNSTEN